MNPFSIAQSFIWLVKGKGFGICEAEFFFLDIPLGISFSSEIEDEDEDEDEDKEHCRLDAMASVWHSFGIGFGVPFFHRLLALSACVLLKFLRFLISVSARLL